MVVMKDTFGSGTYLVLSRLHFLGSSHQKFMLCIAIRGIFSASKLAHEDFMRRQRTADHEPQTKSRRGSKFFLGAYDFV